MKLASIAEVQPILCKNSQNIPNYKILYNNNTPQSGKEAVSQTIQSIRHNNSLSPRYYPASRHNDSVYKQQ